MEKERVFGQGKIKKAERKARKEGLRSHYVMVARIPNEKGLKTYSKIVTHQKASVLVDGRPTYSGVREHLSRQFVVVDNV